ncbi:RNA polymerase sigma factor [Streptomyces sp. LaPpAH-108]|uniref:RNA polymerase sigma factor n=1 Tax=Streptomyces sp. LaPpAH-108 TaxID=1155714 RepID=UPI00037132F2|nr:sigma-70 family RNA polymerase sigma factor [Streptomyces sp. LaPpAH-108]
MTTSPQTGPAPASLIPKEPALITRARHGDPEAFGELYRLHRGVVAAFIGRRVRSNPALAEDLTSDVFVKAWSKISTFRWTGTPIRAWLCTIAHHVVADHFKVAATRRLTFVDQITHIGDTWAVPVSTAEDTVLSTLDVDGLLAALAGITPRQQAVIRLRFLDEMSISETARTLGTTDGAVKTLQWRALGSLRKAYTGAAA